VTAIGLYYADTRSAPAGAIDRLVTDEDRARLSPAARPLRRAQYLAGRALLRFALERCTGLPAAAHRLRVREGGKLECLDGPSISVSHDGACIAVAVSSHGEIGIDLQRAQARRHTAEISRRHFSEAENAWLDDADPAAFYELWVLKEAYLKARGTGLSGGLDSLECHIAPPVIEAKCAVPAALALYTLGDAYLGVAALERGTAEVRTECWQPDSRFPSPPRLVATTASF
jgi:4'-phosphopantetheinyl transferase